MEDQGDVVDGNIDNTGRSQGGELQDVQLPVGQRVAWVEDVLLVDERVELLREDKDDQEDARHDPEDDLAGRVPRVDAAAERDGHDKRDHPAAEDQQAEPVELLELVLDRQRRLQVNRRQHEDEDRREDGEDDQVDVESPSPGGAAVGECASNLDLLVTR